MPIERKRPVIIAQGRQALPVCLADPDFSLAGQARPLTTAPNLSVLTQALGESTLQLLGNRLTADGTTQSLMKLQPGTQLDIRLRIIYTVDASGMVDGAKAPTAATLKPMFTALVDGMRQDWAGTGINFVYYPDCDFEVRTDSRLNNDFTLSSTDLKKFPAADNAFTQAQVDAMISAGSNTAHRNAVAAEKPNTLLWLVCEPNALVLDPKSNKWIYIPHNAGSWSGGGVDFVVLNKYDFAQSAQHNIDDASRAAHETGHFLHLDHTHREPIHDEPSTPVLNNPTPQQRLDRWKKVIADWIDTKVAAGTTPAKALEVYDFDRGNVPDTPADPGGGLLALANQVAGGPFDALGKTGSVSVSPKNVKGAVTFTPDRNNPMSYYLGGPASVPMKFTSGQAAAMRGALVDGNRRRLVAAQLGDTAEPQVRMCAVWSPRTDGQYYSTRMSLDSLKARHADYGAKGFRLAAQCAYVIGSTVFYDAIWDQGARQQSILWGWLDKDVAAELAKKAAQGWRVVHIQAYRHPGTGLRYNVVFEPGPKPQTVRIGLSQAQLDQAWNDLMPKGNRIRLLDATADETGTARYSVVFEAGNQQQRYVAGWALSDLAPEYGVEWGKSRRLSQISLAASPGGPRYTAVWNPENAGQLVMWFHVRERARELYDQMWCQGYRLRSFDTYVV